MSVSTHCNQPVLSKLVTYKLYHKELYTCFPQVDILSASPGKMVCEMRVEEEHTNRGGTLHGGLTATLVDVISTMAIMNSERGAPGVSVDMNIT